MTNGISRLMFYQLRFTHWFQQNQWLPWWLWASLVAQLVKNLPVMQETWVQSLGWEDPLEKGTTEDEMVGWHHRLSGREFEQAPGVGDGQGGLSC